MRSVFWFILTALAIVGGVVCGLTAHPLRALGCAVVALAALSMSYRSIALQLKSIRIGTDLLRSQDFASRLRHVGQKEADSMVDLYNTLITRMKEERLRTEEQNDFLIKLVDASPMGIAICDFDGKIESSNRAFDCMKSPELTEALKGLGYGDTVTIRPSGGRILRCSRQYFMDHGFRRPFFLVELLTDEILHAETDVFHKIIRTMGHEVNNTIGGVVSVLETIGEMHSDEPEIAAVTDSCRTSCLRLGEFVRSYSDVVKLPDPVLERTDLHRLLNDSLTFLRNLAGDNIEIVVEDAGKAAVANIDPMLIQRVLINAVKNSVESIGDRPGRIALRAYGTILEVTDNGRGIAPEVANRIFTPFFSTKNPDRGLGLMLIADILHRHRADFSLTTAPTTADVAPGGPASAPGGPVSLTTLRIRF